MFPLEITELAPVRAASIAHTGPYAGIGAAFQGLFAWAGPRGLIGPGSRMLGVYYDSPDEVPAEHLRSAAAIEIGPEVELDPSSEDGVRELTLAGGIYAVVQYEGAYERLVDAYRWIYYTALAERGVTPSDQPCYELYLTTPESAPPDQQRVVIHVPLASTPPV